MEWFKKIDEALPPIRIEEWRNECDFYGASDEIAKSLGLTQTPLAWASWMHGWIFVDHEFPESYTWNHAPTREVILVFREEQKRLLRKHGYPATFAVGAPFLYAQPVPLPRLDDSLLIMPIHSLDYTHHKFDDEGYFAELDPYLSKFKHVAACIYPADVQKGNWLGALSRRGIPYFVGANSRDRNGLARVRSIMSAFSHMTTNWLGSHLPYAAYCGCSVSIHGSRPRIVREDFRDDLSCKAYPHLFEVVFEQVESGYLERKFAPFFRPPTGNNDDREWAAAQLGHENMRTPLEIARLFHWMPGAQDDGIFDPDEWAPQLGWKPALESRAQELQERVDELQGASKAVERGFQQKQRELEAEVKRLQRRTDNQEERLQSKNERLQEQASKIKELQMRLEKRNETLPR